MDPVRAETYLRVLAESELRRLPSAWPRDLGRTRIWLAATALIAAGGIDADTVLRLLADLDDAAALRPGRAPGMPGVAPRYLRGRAWPRPAARPGEAGVGLRAVPAGVTLALSPGNDGWRGEFRLLALVMAEGYAAVTVAARWVARAGCPAPRHPSYVPFDHLDAVDDQGRPYQVSLWDWGLEDGREWWDAHLALSPAPPPGTRRLDIGTGTDGTRVRLDLAAPPTPAEVVAGPAPAVGAAARVLGRAAEALLSAGRSAVMTGVSDRVAQVTQALTEGGAVSAGEPALAQLATLATALGLELGIPGAGHAPLPEAWTSIMGARRASDGPQGVAPFAVALPEVDGAIFTLAGLRSWREAATLHVLAQGWQPYGWGWLAFGGRDDGPPDPPISWQARDSTGRWHLVEQMNLGDRSDRVVQIQAHLTPPLHPAATSLEVIVTGISTQVRATVPLCWQTAVLQTAP